MKAGQAKDAISVGVFSIALLLALKRDIPKTALIWALVMAIIIDGIFTLNPDLHCEDVERAKPILLAQVLVSVAIIMYLLKN